MKNIDKGTRFTNFLIDITVVYILWIVYYILFQPYGSDNLVLYLIMFLYYTIFEAIKGQTLGKMFTKTKVVRKDGSRPTFLHILMRSFLRVIPIDAMSYMFGMELGFHDRLSFTKLSMQTKI